MEHDPNKVAFFFVLSIQQKKLITLKHIYLAYKLFSACESGKVLKKAEAKSHGTML